MKDNLITIQEAAKMLALAPSTLYQWAERAKIPHVRLGRCVRFRVSQLIEFIEKNTTEVNTAPPPPPAPRQRRRPRGSGGGKRLDKMFEQAKNEVLNKTK